MFFYRYDPTYMILIPAIILSLIAQAQIKSVYSKYRNVKTLRGITGYEAAQKLLYVNGLTDVRIELVKGNLTDHYDPRSKVLRLSNDIYHGNSIASVGVASHEVGHAIQHDKGYAPLKLRNFMVPVANFGSKFSWILFFAGLLMSSQTLVYFGIYLFAAIVFFQIVTLPVEINASRRAVYHLVESNIIYEEEKVGVKKVLNAAAMTYLASTLMAVLQLVRLLAIANRYRGRD